MITPSPNINNAKIERVVDVNVENPIAFTPTDEAEANQYGNIVDGVRDIRADEKTTNVIKERLEASFEEQPKKSHVEDLPQRRENQTNERQYPSP